MATPQILDDILSQLKDKLPLKEDVEKHVRQLLQTAFNKFELVSAEEFEVQKKVLARTRAKLEILEKQVAELEQELQQRK